ncbi:hypothetical protein [Lentzea indica]|uniref:hypothetical protein n=1 Tax=Lentzea indica TaxID=2604800 RepID=UPI001CB6BED0|nr:hypothetical protein [Lentzea indica]
MQRTTRHLGHRADHGSVVVQRDQRDELPLATQGGVHTGQMHAVVHRIGFEERAGRGHEVPDVVVH